MKTLSVAFAHLFGVNLPTRMETTCHGIEKGLVQLCRAGASSTSSEMKIYHSANSMAEWKNLPCWKAWLMSQFQVAVDYLCHLFMNLKCPTTSMRLS
jgi:hypothetical protein